MRYLFLFSLISIIAFSCKKKNKTPDVSTEPVNSIASKGAGVYDIDSNFYETTIIKNSGEWTSTNLKVVHFNNGDTIFSGRKIGDISGMAQPSFFFYSNGDSTTVNKYGRLYTYYVVEDSRKLCPSGWHVPTKTDYDTLIYYTGFNEESGGKLKSTSLWASPNTGADNSSLYSGLPAGFRTPDNTYPEITKTGIFWTATNESTNTAWAYYLKYNYPTIFQAPHEKKKAFSVRCKRN